MSIPTKIFLNCILAFVLAGLIGVTITLSVWIADRETPVTVQKTTLLTPVVKPGEVFAIRQDLTYERDCSGHIDRFLFDSANPKHRKQLEDVDYYSPPDGLGERSLTTKERVPEDFVDGKAYYTAIPVYTCNWVHKHFWPIARRPTIVEFQVKR